MKKYIKNHKSFIITVSILIVILITSSLFLFINKNSSSTIKLENITNKSFILEIKEKDILTKTKITFNNDYTGTKELTINDDTISYSFKYSIEKDEDNNDVILLDNNGQYESYSYKKNCIIDNSINDIIYCIK